MALRLLVDAGKVRYAGISHPSAGHLMKAVGVSERLGLPRPVSRQISSSLRAREAEHELVPATIDQGSDLLVRHPLAAGLLSGEHRRGQQAPEGPRQLQEWNEPLGHDQEELDDTVKVAIAEDRGAPPPGGAREDAVSRPPRLHPSWHRAGTAADRLSAADLTPLARHPARARRCSGAVRGWSPRGRPTPRWRSARRR